MQARFVTPKQESEKKLGCFAEMELFKPSKFILIRHYCDAIPSESVLMLPWEISVSQALTICNICSFR